MCHFFFFKFRSSAAIGRVRPGQEDGVVTGIIKLFMYGFSHDHGGSDRSVRAANASVFVSLGCGYPIPSDRRA